jgi:hypothetical protein
MKVTIMNSPPVRFAAQFSPYSTGESYLNQVTNQNKQALVTLVESIGDTSDKYALRYNDNDEGLTLFQTWEGNTDVSTTGKNKISVAVNEHNPNQTLQSLIAAVKKHFNK